MVRVWIAKSSERYNGMPIICPELEKELETELTRARASKSKFLEERVLNVNTKNCLSTFGCSSIIPKASQSTKMNDTNTVEMCKCSIYF